jgi:iron complex transport system ATP-binding protein
VTVLHDLNLAAQYCDRLLVMHEGRLAAEGPPADVLTPDTIRRVFGVEPVVLPHPSSGVPQLLLQPGGRSESPAAVRHEPRKGRTIAK